MPAAWRSNRATDMRTSPIAKRPVSNSASKNLSWTSRASQLFRTLCRFMLLSTEEPGQFMSKHFGRMLFLASLAVAAPAAAQLVAVRISVAPPVLPVYEQPICPAPGYLWTPGYWAYGDAGYFWVPGVWLQPPSVGLLWTPGYWGFEGPVYIWHEGYWGPHLGFYGGVNYGFGYTGVGFLGGIWVGSVFRYNTAVMHVGVGFHDVYVDRAAIVEGGARYSFNGPGGWSARATERERLAERDHHVERMAAQRDHEHAARMDRGARFSENH